MGHFTQRGGWVVATSGLDVLEKRISFVPTGIRNPNHPVCSLVTILTTLTFPKGGTSIWICRNDIPCDQKQRVQEMQAFTWRFLLLRPELNWSGFTLYIILVITCSFFKWSIRHSRILLFYGVVGAGVMSHWGTSLPQLTYMFGVTCLAWQSARSSSAGCPVCL
jgi:hypothetical protein